jgi:hypothetical protein
MHSNQVLVGEVQKLLSSNPPKASPLYFLPAQLLKSSSAVFTLIIAHMAYLSFAEGHFPMAFKTAHVLPLIKKPKLDKDQLSANLKFVHRVQSAGAAGLGQVASPSDRVVKFFVSTVSLQEWSLN